MKKKCRTAVGAVALLCAAAASCSIDEGGLPGPDTVEVDGRDVPASAFEQGMVRMLLTEELAAELAQVADSAGEIRDCRVKSVSDAAASLGIVRMERTFPYAGKFEARTRKAGLHLWYDVYFDSNVVLTRASGELSSIPGVKSVEFRSRTVRVSGRLVPESVSSSPKVQPGKTAADVFDDPFLLTEQWHYFNDGSYPRSKAGADVDVLPVWEDGIVGDKDVIVAVVDGGIDYRHEDLADNIWSDPDIQDPDYSHGYNFVRRSYQITPDDHGTHVAGTIAAVNNNGVGVCGIAGGDKAAGIPGVRLMSCQIFEGESGASAAAAIKWGADHGAVISQNSWGYDEDAFISDTPPSDKAAIDYFVQYAGYDENGEQTGPMAGGIVIFAAGNEERDRGFPGAYENCVAVGAIAADYQESYYTNYGSWVDVCAPGGDRFKNQLVYSTLPGNEYGGMEGTSMACPHVSGVAALLVSRFGGPGFTSAQLRDMIEGSVRDISEYTDPSKYIGKGLVDAGKAMSMASTIAPGPVLDFSAEGRSNFIDFTLTVPADEDDGAPSYVTLHYSGLPFDPSDDTVVDALPVKEVSLEGAAPGDRFSGTAGGFDFNTEYYVSASVRDVARNRSALYPEAVKIVTGGNSAPVITPSDRMDLTVRYKEVKEVEVRAEDPDGHSLVAVVSGVEGVSALMEGNIVRLTFDGHRMPVGEGLAILTVSDGFGGEASLEINVNVVRNTPPQSTGKEGRVVVNMGAEESVSVDLSEYFSDVDGDELSYMVQSQDVKVADVSFNGDVMVLRPVAQGIARLVVAASDKMDETVSAVFDVLVRDGGRAADFYPNPVVSVLNVRTGVATEDASLSVMDSNGSTKISLHDLDISPFSPMAVNFSGLPGGMYHITLEFTDQEGTSRKITADIAKL